MEYFLILIVIGVISSIISAVAKSKKREEERHGSEGQPIQPRPLSDIQKAMMMAQETATQRPAPQHSAYTQPQQYMPPQRPAYVQPQQYGMPPQRPAYVQPQQYGMPPQRPAYAQQEAHAPMQARTTSPLEARTVAPPEARTAAAPSELYNGSMNVLTSEGFAGDSEGERPAEISRHLHRRPGASLETNGHDAPERPSQTTAHAQPGRIPLKLFDGQNEYIKAVIYTEVLTRRTPGRRSARA